jgi:hypothetical protein
MATARLRATTGVGRATGLGQQQQREQAGDLGLVRHQRRQDPRQPDRLGAEIRFG